MIKYENNKKINIYVCILLDSGNKDNTTCYLEHVHTAIP